MRMCHMSHSSHGCSVPQREIKAQLSIWSAVPASQPGLLEVDLLSLKLNWDFFSSFSWFQMNLMFRWNQLTCKLQATGSNSAFLYSREQGLYLFSVAALKSLFKNLYKVPQTGHLCYPPPAENNAVTLQSLLQVMFVMTSMLPWFTESLTKGRRRPPRMSKSPWLFMMKKEIS